MRAKLSAWFKPDERQDGYIPAADAFRVICVLLVSWFHIWQQSWLTPALTIGSWRLDLLPLVRTGYLMVDMMLLLSGFLLFLPYARAHSEGKALPDTRTFYMKRALRIIPAYYLCVLFGFFVQALPGHAYSSWRAMLLDILGHLTFTHNLTYEGYIGSKLTGVLWTMAVECQFYLIAPFLARAFLKKPVWTYLGMTAVAFVYRFVYVNGMNSTSLYFNRLPAMLDVYANGFAFACLSVWLKKKLKPGALGSLFGIVISLAAMYGVWRIAREQATRYDQELIHMGQMIHRFPLSFLGGALLLCGTQAPKWLSAIMGCRAVRFLSAVSYNFYMWHATVALTLRKYHIPPYESDMPQRDAEQPWQWQYTLLCFAAALIVATALTYLWEKPCARKGMALIKQGRHDKREPDGVSSGGA